MALNIRYKPAEEALLHASLLQGAPALDAFAQWRALYDMDASHDEAQHRLIPLLYTNMVTCGLNDPIMPKLKAIHRLSWGAAQLRKKVASETIGHIRAAGLPVMVTKGMALGQGYYADAGQRPMSDIDLMVPADSVLAALDILESRGWRYNEARLKGSDRARRAYLIRTQTVELRKPDCPSIDLHWQPFHECDTQKTCERFWADAEPFEIDREMALRPSPTHMLFHTIVHGLRPNVFSPVRWVADATVILREAGGAIDWTAFFALARETHVSHRIQAGLAYVQPFADLNGCHPSAVTKSSLIEHYEQRAFNEIHRVGDFGNMSVMRKLLIPRLLRFAMSDKVRHMPYLLSDIVDRKMLNRS